MAHKQFDIAVLGEINPDLILRGDVMPEFGQVEQIVDIATLTIGSSSVIFACGAARLGMQVAFIGKTGRDIFGDYMRAAMVEYGINVDGIITDPDHQTGISVILSVRNDRAILTYPGTIPLLTVREVNLDIIQRARHLHSGSYYLQKGLQPGLHDLFQSAHEWGLSTSLDTNYDPENEWNGGVKKLLEDVDVFLPNEIECMRIAGANSLVSAVDTLREKVKLIGVKRGNSGAMLISGSTTYEVDPLDVEVIDTVGAGDSFDAGFIYAYLSGWENERILRLANACGGLSAQKAGGTDGQPTLDEAMRYI